MISFFWNGDDFRFLEPSLAQKENYRHLLKVELWAYDESYIMGEMYLINKLNELKRIF